MRLNLLGVVSVIASVVAGAANSACAQDGQPIRIAVRDGQFRPAEASGPAGVPFSVRVENFDTKSVEFSSATMRIDAFISPNTSETVKVGAMLPGRYTFFDAARSGAHGILILK